MVFVNISPSGVGFHIVSPSGDKHYICVDNFVFTLERNRDYILEKTMNTILDQYV